MVKIKSFVLLNSDSEVLPDNISKNTKVITYGLGSKSTITASSIGEDEITVCVQRGFTNVNGINVIPQEIPVKVSEKHNDISDILCETAINLVVGLNCADFE